MSALLFHFQFWKKAILEIKVPLLFVKESPIKRRGNATRIQNFH
jgi:hypothetical protein